MHNLHICKYKKKHNKKKKSSLALCFFKTAHFNTQLYSILLLWQIMTMTTGNRATTTVCNTSFQNFVVINTKKNSGEPKLVTHGSHKN